MARLLLQRARNSGKCPPLMLSEDRINESDGFENGLLRVLDIHGFFIAFDAAVAAEFPSILQKAESLDKVPGLTSQRRKATLEQRRCIILAVVGSTPGSSPSLARILSDGYLAKIKVWLDEILNGTVGGVDLLLHLLSNVAALPVTKSLVKGSGMGKVIGSIEKHRICAGTPNEAAIKDRINRIKDSWNASVKALKSQDTNGETKISSKRLLDSPVASPMGSKRVKAVEENKKGSSFSSLLKKVKVSSSATDANSKAAAAAAAAAAKANALAAKNGISKREPEKKGGPKKPSQRVKWADHFGGDLANSQLVEGEEVSDVGKTDTTVSWSDRKKRDRLREKELLSKVKKAKLMDDDDNEIDMPKQMLAKVDWRPPSLLPDRPEITKALVVSKEIGVQNDRMKTVTPVQYFAEYDVPSNPAPLSDVEQALDMTSQSSAVVASIPFFIPQQPPAAATDMSYPENNQAPPSTSVASVAAAANATAAAVAFDPSLPLVSAAGATPDFVQALGLPMFLVGQNVQALQTLASSPSLLSTLVDANGMYDQPRLLSLVQTLSATNGGQCQQAPAPAPSYASAQPPFQSSTGMYGFGSNDISYGQSSFSSNSTKNGFRSSSEGNLHISGYGPTTTQAEIISLFSPYVQVDEVVMKGTFAFVNTSDPVNAQRAREALTGTLLGGMPLRINAAQRKNRDNSSSLGGVSSGGSSSSFSGSGPSTSSPQGIQGSNQPGSNVMTQASIDAVRDDRGNPATKNLFVAGYGPGTTEQQIRELFSLHATVIGVVLKGTFTFVNTADRESAIRAREVLGGTTFNGGVLRINFAKETGRLGTSFDLTYGPNTGPNAGRNNSTSYYGRPGY